MKPFLLLLFFGCASICLKAQNPYTDRQFQFLSFEAIPTWTGVATDWDKAQPKIHLYDSEQYKGHAQYISVALKTGITFAQFKEQVRDYKSRKYMPFFLFDLRKKPVTLNAKSYTWALRIEDYSYQDNAEQMTETTLRLLRLITEYIRTATGKTTNGIIVLAGNPNAQPNTNIAPALTQAGFPHQGTNQLLTAMGGKAIHVLNNGKGYGYLRYISTKEETTAHVNAHDIVIYETLPARVPPVAGILTLEPQTPLSHVNLLAKNRGTFNLYALDTSAIPGLHAQIGKLVKIECTDQRITLHSATLKEAEAYWASHSLKIELPTANTSVPELIDLGQKEPLEATLVGAKAANYARLQRLFPNNVKPGHAISFYHYAQTLRKSGADTKITAFLTQKPTLIPEQIEAHLSEIRKAILASKVSPDLLAAIRDLAKAKYPNQRIRLRSSTNCEDLPGFNGAGLYLSKGLDPDDSPAQLEQKLLEIYASLWTSHAFAEREYYGIDHSKAMMAILINEAYSAEYANGVTLTIPDKTGFAIAINTQIGDAAITNPEGGQIPEALLYKTADSKTFTTESRSNIHDIFLQAELKPALEELKQLTIQVHKAFSTLYPQKKGTAYGVDIEFKVVQEGPVFKIYIKQARPLGQILPE